MTFQERLRLAMDRAKISNTQLADHLGVSVQAVGKWLRKGQVHRDRISALAKFLNVSPTWLLEGTGSEQLSVGEEPGTYTVVSPIRSSLNDFLPMATESSINILEKLILKVRDGQLTEQDLEAILPTIDRLAKGDRQER